MKTSLLCLIGVFAAIQAKGIGVPRPSVSNATEERSWICYVIVWSEPHQQGHYQEFNERVPYLDVYHLDNTISSVRVSGVWLFYGAPEYNLYEISYVHWSWGLDYSETFADQINNGASSLRYAGSQTSMNEDGYNLYAGRLFTKNDHYDNKDVPDLTKFHQEVKSIIIIGRSEWKFCEGVYYTGHCNCLRAKLHDGDSYHRLDVGFYEDIHNGEVYLNGVKSVKKGCY